MSGWAGTRLLDTYHPERQPVGVFTADQSYQLFAGTRSPRPFGNWGVIFGAAYASDAVVPDGSAAPQIADPVVDYVPCARPGDRAPHAWGTVDTGRASTVDLFGAGFVLLSRSTAWTGAAGAVAARLDVPLAPIRVGVYFRPEDPAGFDALYGIGRRGAVLVRPDGHVGWRTVDDADAPERLERVIRTIVARAG